MIKTKNRAVTLLDKDRAPRYEPKPYEGSPAKQRLLQSMTVKKWYTVKALILLTRIDASDAIRHLNIFIKDGFVERSKCSLCCSTIVYRRIR